MVAARKWPESQYRCNERPRERLMKVPETSPGHLSDGEVRSRFSNRPPIESERVKKKRKKKKERLGGEERRNRERRMIPVSETLFEATNE